jgi:valyl-tRNA synthetase
LVDLIIRFDAVLWYSPLFPVYLSLMNLPKTYEPGEYEPTIYGLWEQSGAFIPKNRGSKTNFSIVIPPPNANGNLHIGHGLTLALEDTAVRYHRMKGEASLLLPGADHAGFETQVVYEKELLKQGKSRFDLSREELYQQIWEFVAQNKDNYESQFRRLGASVDWSRYTYTLDKKIVKRAYETFKKLWDDGLIYRGERLVNYCTHHRTAFADIEVTYKEEKGHLWHIRYPLTDGSGEVIVATTRPETMLGDTAVAVNPTDTRYTQLVGKTAKLPLTGREVPIVADDFVENEFGTGAVKITPAHDPNDFEAAQRNSLPMINILNHDGTLNHEVPEQYRGLKIADARKAVVNDLEEQGYLTKTENYTHSVGHCYKCGTVIEPLLMEQWFVDMKSLARPAIDALETDAIDFQPASKKRQLITYLQGLRDWNISRQIAWGIPIPAFRNPEDTGDWIYDERVDQETIEINGRTYHRDPDVFDTWFSSSSWPYATLDYPDSADFDRFYPLSVMETGADILFPWVSRMLMLGIYVTGTIPFKKVYLHGLIQDEHGQKMSKSKGNVVDPMEKVEQFGSDAFRMGILADESAGKNRPFDESKLVGARNFCNKLWNVARYIEGVIGDSYERRHEAEPINISDFWMLSKLQQSTEKISKDLDNYRFAEAYETLYHTVWDDFADWYLEANKDLPNHALLAHFLETLLKLAHPFAPFVTETIWQTLKWENDSLLITAEWPKAKRVSLAEAAEAFETVRLIVADIRNITANLGLRKPVLGYTDSNFLEEHSGLIIRLGKLTGLNKGSAGDGLRLTSTQIDCWLEIEPETAKEYLSRLEEKQTAEAVSVERLKARLANKSYIENAPKQLVDETKGQLVEAEARLTQITAEIDSFTAA